MRFSFTGSTFSSRGGCLFAFNPSKKSFTSVSTIFAFSSSVLSYGNFSRGLRDGPYLYCLPPLDVPLAPERRRFSSVVVYDTDKEAECSDAPEQTEWRRLSSAVADEAEEEPGCSDTPD